MTIFKGKKALCESKKGHLFSRKKQSIKIKFVSPKPFMLVFAAFGRLAYSSSRVDGAAAYKERVKRWARRRRWNQCSKSG
jgi:hypothetical protein